MITWSNVLTVPQDTLVDAFKEQPLEMLLVQRDFFAATLAGLRDVSTALGLYTGLTRIQAVYLRDFDRYERLALACAQAIEYKQPSDATPDPQFRKRSRRTTGAQHLE